MCKGACNITGPKNEVLREVGALARFIQSISDVAFREIKLQRGQFIFVTRICEKPGLNLIELSGILRVDKTTTTKAIQKLIEENYVRRERDDSDKRMWRLYPTSKALEMYPFIIREENWNIDACYAGFSTEEREMAYNLIRRMRENIEQGWSEKKN